MIIRRIKCKVADKLDTVPYLFQRLCVTMHVQRVAGTVSDFEVVLLWIII